MKFITASAIAMAALFGIMWLGWRMHPEMTFGEAGRLAVSASASLIFGIGIGAFIGLLYIWHLKGRSR